MNGLEFFERLQTDMRLDLGSHTFEEEEIIRFATKFDPQPFHLDAEQARHSIFGGLCASGWHTASIWMRHNMIHGAKEWLRVSGHTGEEPVLGPSPGVRNLRWPAPVFVGDTVTFSSTLTGKRINPKRAGWALLTVYSSGINQDGVLVLAMDGAVTLKLE